MALAKTFGIRFLVLCLSLSMSPLIAAAYPASAEEPSGAMLLASSLEDGKLTATFKAGAYRIEMTSEGHRIEMEGLGYRTAPGSPMLPFKNFLFALPPGARVRSVQVENINTRTLPGRYQVVPVPVVLPLSDPRDRTGEHAQVQREWRQVREKTYGSDRAFPGASAKLMGSGAFRQYAYAGIGFYPFTYHPRSGRLILNDTVKVTVRFSLPSPESAEARTVKALMRDTSFLERAEELFVNFPQVKGLYKAEQVPGIEPVHNYDYVIITTYALKSSITVTEFIDWKKSRGHNPRIVLISDPEIANQPGSDLSAKMRNFLRSYYGLWGIQYVLLVGDVDDVPMRYCFADPTNHTSYPGDPYKYGGETPTDYYYADLSSPDSASWDSDGDGYRGEYGEDQPDFAADVYVGRIPTSASYRIIYTLGKLVAFEKDTGAWKDQALHVGAILAFENEDHSGHPKVDGARVPFKIENDMMSGWTVSHYSEQEGLETSDYLWPALSKASFLNDWRTGQYGIVNWSGHGSYLGAGRLVWVWDDGDGVPETDGSDVIDSPTFIDVWSNLEEDYPSIVFAISCSIGYPEPQASGNMGIDILTKPGFGASAGIVSASRGAAAAINWLTDNGGVESFCYEFNRCMIIESLPAGDSIYNSKFFCNHNYAWDHYWEYKNMFGMNLYGDPALVR
ncbi:MAG: C25 family cysteine peptidase [Planctomycetota bacterium]